METRPVRPQPDRVLNAVLPTSYTMKSTIQTNSLATLDIAFAAAIAEHRAESDPRPAIKGIATKARKAFAAAMTKPTPSPWADKPLDPAVEAAIARQVGAPRTDRRPTQAQRDAYRNRKAEFKAMRERLGPDPDVFLLDEGRRTPGITAAVKDLASYSGDGDPTHLATAMAAKAQVGEYGTAYEATVVRGGRLGLRQWAYANVDRYAESWAVPVNHRRAGAIAIVLRRCSKAKVAPAVAKVVHDAEIVAKIAAINAELACGPITRK